MYLILLWTYNRNDPGFRLVKSPDCSGFAAVLRAEGEMATIIVPDPTKCLMLQREHIKCTTIDDLTIIVNDCILNGLLQSIQTLSYEEWQNGLSHVLKIYQPTRLHVLSLNRIPENNDFIGHISETPIYTVFGNKQNFTFCR